MRMFGKIQADESLQGATRVAVGSGTATNGPAIMRAWDETTGRSPATTPQQRVSASIKRLTAQGYGLRKVPKKAGGRA